MDFFAFIFLTLFIMIFVVSFPLFGYALAKKNKGAMFVFPILSAMAVVIVVILYIAKKDTMEAGTAAFQVLMCFAHFSVTCGCCLLGTKKYNRQNEDKVSVKKRLIAYAVFGLVLLISVTIAGNSTYQLPKVKDVKYIYIGDENYRYPKMILWGCYPGHRYRHKTNAILYPGEIDRNTQEKMSEQERNELVENLKKIGDDFVSDRNEIAKIINNCKQMNPNFFIQIHMFWFRDYEQCEYVTFVMNNGEKYTKLYPRKTLEESGYLSPEAVEDRTEQVVREVSKGELKPPRISMGVDRYLELMGDASSKALNKIMVCMEKDNLQFSDESDYHDKNKGRIKLVYEYKLPEIYMNFDFSERSVVKYINATPKDKHTWELINSYADKDEDED